MDKLISVILPCFNAELFIYETIVSIINQDYKNFELIIINDGSTDRSIDIINKFQDQRIKVYTKKNTGIIDTLNFGIDASKGEFIARIDSDDLASPNRLSKQLEYMLSENLDICGSHYMLIDQNSKIIGMNLVPLNYDILISSLAIEVPFAHPSVMIRKEFLTENSLSYGQSKFRIAEDYDLWIRMFNAGAKFGNVDLPLLSYRVLGNSLSRKNKRGILNNTRKIRYIFFKENEKLIYNLLQNFNHQRTLNSKEKDLLIRLILSYSIYTKRSVILNKLKFFSKRKLIITILSFIKNF